MNKQLLFTYFAGQATASQKKEVEDWLLERNENQELFYHWLAEWERNHPKHSINAEQDFRQFTARLEEADLLPESSPSAQRRVIWWQTPFRVAAAVTLLVVSLAVAYLFLNSFDKTQRYETAYGETRTVTLPDGSRVILNAHSSVEFDKEWQPDQVREVRLDGEAFFSVVHTANHQKFIVKTSDAFDVEVLGTQFTVSRRTAKTQVMLESGKVRLNIREEGEKQSVLMKPGDLAQFESSPKNLVIKRVNPKVYTSWTRNEWVLEDVPLGEVALRIEQTFGVKVVVPNPALARDKMTGLVPAHNLEEVLEGISTVYNLRVVREAGQVTLQK